MGDFKSRVVCNWVLWGQARPYICHAQCSNYTAATHNITHSPCTSTYTTHPPLLTSLPSTTLLCTQLINTKHVFVSGSKMAQDVGMVWKCCHFHFVWLVFEGFIPTLIFHQKTFLWLSYLTTDNPQNICERVTTTAFQNYYALWRFSQWLLYLQDNAWLLLHACSLIHAGVNFDLWLLYLQDRGCG